MKPNYEFTLKNVGTVIWNGPVGLFRFDRFHFGTQTIAQAVTTCKDFTLAGGGDTIAAIEEYNVAEKIDYISTAGARFWSMWRGRSCRRWPLWAQISDRQIERCKLLISSVSL